MRALRDHECGHTYLPCTGARLSDRTLTAEASLGDRSEIARRSLGDQHGMRAPSHKTARSGTPMHAVTIAPISPSSSALALEIALEVTRLLLAAEVVGLRAEGLEVGEEAEVLR